MLQGFQSTEDVDGLVKVLSDIKAPDGRQAAMLAAKAANSYAQTVASKRGAKTALDLIARLEAAVSTADLKKEDEKAKAAAKPGAQTFASADYFIYAVANGKAEILNEPATNNEPLSLLTPATKN